MSKADPSVAVLETPFRVESIEQTAAPAGSDGVWCCYVISQGTNQITGMRAGSRSQVAAQLDEMVERLNERRVGKQRAKSSR
ncbi:MAG TPA: hypothetical protein VK025_01510 [Steroidobacter sp.]|jgi:hypothetical protein|nr:hypothetical protein [Steroidobacteraceae bacterium]HLS80064.1 hypothetical protein [Steroidobacter sp.]